MTELDALWTAAYRQIMGLAAHELKDALNGVALNLEVLRSRIAAGKVDEKSLGGFAEAAHDQFETVTARAEAVMFLSRPPRSGAADVAVTLKQLALLLVPAAKADGTQLTVGGYDVSVETTAPAMAVRLALASGILALIKEGGAGAVKLEKGQETVVRFSHESAAVGDLDPAIIAALTPHAVRARRTKNSLEIQFP